MTEVETFLAGSGPASRAFYQFMRFLVVTFCRLYLRQSVEGREHVPTSGAFVLAPVHRSYVDTPIVASATRRRMRYMGKDTLWHRPRFGWMLSALGAFPVSRGKADREALMRCIEVLRAGEPLVLFAEGERKCGPIVQPLFNGAAYAACKANVPIVPVGIGGSERAMPKGAKFVYPRKVHMIIGAPIHPRVDGSGRAPREAVKELSAELHAEMQRLFDAAQARVG